MSAVLHTEVRRHRLTSDEFHRMGEAGILRADERVELIDGEVIDMAPIGSNHAGTVGFLAKRLERAVGDSALVFVQNPLALAAASEPQPDLMLLKARADFYRSAHPRPDDVLLIVEVADTTLTYDRDIKMPLYARHGIPGVWLVDLANKRLHVFTSPSDPGYLESRSLARPGLLATAALPGSPVDLRGLF
ncbi:MAG: Uma2 family endonuclease [Gammaproteobacteria bacterium]